MLPFFINWGIRREDVGELKLKRGVIVTITWMVTIVITQKSQLLIDCKLPL